MTKLLDRLALHDSSVAGAMYRHQSGQHSFLGLLLLVLTATLIRFLLLFWVFISFAWFDLSDLACRSRSFCLFPVYNYYYFSMPSELFDTLPFQYLSCCIFHLHLAATLLQSDLSSFCSLLLFVINSQYNLLRAALAHYLCGTGWHCCVHPG